MCTACTVAMATAVHLTNRSPLLPSAYFGGEHVHVYLRARVPPLFFRAIHPHACSHTASHRPTHWVELEEALRARERSSCFFLRCLSVSSALILARSSVRGLAASHSCSSFRLKGW